MWFHYADAVWSFRAILTINWPTTLAVPGASALRAMVTGESCLQDMDGCSSVRASGAILLESCAGCAGCHRTEYAHKQSMESKRTGLKCTTPLKEQNRQADKQLTHWTHPGRHIRLGICMFKHPGPCQASVLSFNLNYFNQVIHTQLHLCCCQQHLQPCNAACICRATATAQLALQYPNAGPQPWLKPAPAHLIRTATACLLLYCPTSNLYNHASIL